VGSSQILCVAYALCERIKNLYDWIRKEKSEKDVHDKLVRGLEPESIRYIELSEKISKEEEKLTGFVLSIEKKNVSRRANKIVEVWSPLPLLYSKQINALIGLARACKEISVNEGLMGQFKESEPDNYDFICRMGEIYVEPDSLRIGGDFCRFFKMREKEIRRNEALKNACDELEYGNLKEKFELCKREITSERIEKKLRKKIEEDLKELCKSIDKVEFEESFKVDWENYVPPGYLQIVSLTINWLKFGHVKKRVIKY